MVYILLISFIISLALSVVMTWLVSKHANKLGLMDFPGERKKHEYPTPHGGGIAITLATCGLFLLIAAAVSARSLLLPVLPASERIAGDIELAKNALPFLMYITFGGMAIAFVGFLDDIHPFPPIIKLLAQITIITLMVWAARLRITLFIPVDWIQFLMTVMWILLLTNSFNLLDNMDGQSASVAIVCGFSLLICSLFTQQYFIAGFLLCLIGAIAGFLYFNFPPASIFMGDSGSMFIGYMLASAAVLTTFLTSPGVSSWKPVLVPLIIFALPLYDTFSVIMIRLLRKKPIFIGDTNHFSHRLHKAGMSTRHTLLTVCAVTAATSLGATVPYGPDYWQMLVPVIQTLAIITVLIQLELWR